jgi:hypothetical protein
VLAVVQHQQHRPVADVVGNHPDRPSTRLRGEANRVEHRARQRTRIAHRRQLHPPHPTVEVVDRLGGDLQRQPGLSDTARADQRHQPAVTQRRQHRRSVRFPTDQRCQTGRQVVAERTPRSQRPKVDVMTAITQLPHPLSCAQIIQTVRTHAANVRIVEQTLAHDVARGVRHEHLATVSTTISVRSSRRPKRHRPGTAVPARSRSTPTSSSSVDGPGANEIIFANGDYHVPSSMRAATVDAGTPATRRLRGQDPALTLFGPGIRACMRPI